MSKKKSDFFWTSYSDLMTSLFFIMLVLFVLVIVVMRNDQEKMKIKLKEFEKIEEIKKSLNEIDSNYFEYRSEYKKHILKLSVEYPSSGFDINEITDKTLLPSIEQTGWVIKQTIEKFKNSEQIKYLVVIEGQASKDGYYIDDHYNNDVLSYLRALNLKKYWKSKGIDLDNLENCELIVAGSGEGGEPRELPDFRNKKNQRFLIHIIPKTGTIQ
jgi:hypothetical protein